MQVTPGTTSADSATRGPGRASQEHRMKTFQFVLGLLAASAATAQPYTISTVAGTGLVQGYLGDGAPATSAQLDFPLRVAVDSRNNFYIADYLTWVVREVTAAGIISTIAGDGTFGFQGD